MTPKDKSKELVDKFYQFTPDETLFNTPPSRSIISMEYNSWNHAKQCALIAVDEILNDYSYMQNVRNANSNQIHSQRIYWQEVKNEIEKL